MTETRATSIDYTTTCTVAIVFQDDGRESRLVYERPQMQVPNRPLSLAERAQIATLPDDDQLTIEAKAIFSDMRLQRRISPLAVLQSIFIARTAAAALEMNL